MMLNKSSLARWGVIFLFYLVLSQDLVASVWFKLGVPTDVIKAFLFLKEVVVLGIGAVLLIKRNISYLRFILILFTLYASIFLFVPDLPVYYILLGYRTYVLLLLSFLIGEELANVPDFGTTFLKHIKIITGLILWFSFLEYFILPESIWRTLFPIIEMKRAVLGLTIDEYGSSGLPVNAFGELTRRMIGPFNDPLTLAYFSVILFNFFLAHLLCSGVSRVRALLGGILILLTQTRAIIIGLMLSVIGVIFKDRSIRKKYIIFCFAIVSLSMVSVIIFQDWYLAFFNSIFTKEGRNTGHVVAYAEGIKQLIQHPFGHGIGTSSVIVNFSGFFDHSVGTENAFINLAIEIGLLGVLWLISIFIYLIWKFKKYLSSRSAGTTPDYLVVMSGYLLLIQYVFAGFVAPHILIARILIPFMIIIGWAYSITKRRLIDNDRNISQQPLE